MKKNETSIQKRIILFICLVLVGIILWSAYGIFAVEEQEELVHISVIVENNTSARWTSFVLGLEHAAKDHEVDLNIMATGNISNIEEQWNLISQKVEDGTDGIIISPVEAEQISDLNQILSKDVKLAFVESDMIRSEEYVRGILSVTPNAKDMGKAIVDAVKEDYAENLSGKNIKVLTHFPKQYAQAECLNYVQSKLEEEGCVFLNTENTSGEESMHYLNNNQIDICIALDDYSLSIAAKEITEKKKISLYGIGTSETNVYYLDRGIISCMVVPNDFKMGYQALTELADRIRNHKEEEKSIEIEYQTVRPDEVHETQMEQYLYPNKQ